MTILTRLALAMAVLGLLAGVAMRLLLGRRPGPALALVFAPFVVHLLYVGGYALRYSGRPGSVFAFAVVALLAAAAALAWSLRLLRAGSLLLAAVPLLLALVYALPLAWLVQLLARLNVGLDVLPSVSYAGASLFAACALLVYAPRVPRPELTGVLDVLRRRR